MHNKTTAKRALRELKRLQDRPHAWDTEAANVGGIKKDDWNSPVTHGRVLCATCYCGPDADFGNGPRLLIDNDGPANGLLQEAFSPYFQDEKFRKVFHNYSFDRHLMERHGIELKGFLADTLHLARLIDTSLASWEGKVQLGQANHSQRLQAEIAALRPAASAPSVAPAKRVRAVTLGGVHLERKSWSAGASMLHTSIADPTSQGSIRAGASPGVPGGYGLKALTKFFGLSDTTDDPFERLFGSHPTAAEDAHNAAEYFDDWVNYATKDAKLTYLLYQHCHGELKQRPWCSAVHQRPIHEVLVDKKVISDLQNGRCGYGLNSQYETGQNMWDFYETYLRDFGEALADLEKVGIGVDSQVLTRIEADASAAVEKSHRDFAKNLNEIENLGPDGAALVADASLINIQSSQQLQTLLFGGAGSNTRTGEEIRASRVFSVPKHMKAKAAEKDKKHSNRFELHGMGLKPGTKRKDVTKKGLPSTSAQVLKEFAGDESASSGQAYKQLIANGASAEDARRISQSLRQLQAAKKTKALLSGFALPLQRYAETSGRIHPQWKFDTATGRLACRKPNLQNLPRAADDPFVLRSAFQAQPGNVMIVADYSQLEMKLLAHISNCRSMIEKFQRGGDYHSEIAAEMFPNIASAVAQKSVVIDAGTSGINTLPTVKEKFAVERNRAKAINFAIVYGQEAKSLAEDLRISEDEAEDLFRAWYAAKPEVKLWKKQTITESSKSHRALSLLGRWRTLPLIEDSNKGVKRRSERAAVNFAVQGSAADVVMAATLRISKSKHLEELGFKLVLQVHDEFVLEGPEAAVEEASDLLRQFMLEPFKDHQPDFEFRAPLTIDLAVGHSFAEAKP